MKDAYKQLDSAIARRDEFCEALEENPSLVADLLLPTRLERLAVAPKVQVKNKSANKFNNNRRAEKHRKLKESTRTQDGDNDTGDDRLGAATEDVREPSAKSQKRDQGSETQTGPVMQDPLPSGPAMMAPPCFGVPEPARPTSVPPKQNQGWAVAGR